MKCAAPITVLLALFGSAAQSATPQPEFHIRLKPLTTNDQICGIEVTATLVASAHQTAEPLAEIAYVTFNVPAPITELVGPDATDEDGALTLRVRDEGEGDRRKRRWYAERPVHGAVILRYRAPVTNQPAPRGAAPPTELRADGMSVSGAGSAFLLRPPQGRYRFRVSWDLTAMPIGTSAASSFGTSITEPLSLDTLDTAYFMAGALGRHPAQPASNAFFATWQGHPPFDPQPLMAWADRLRSHYLAFFDAPATSYGIFMRRNQVNPGGGMGMYRSFVITYGDDDNDIDDLKFTLAHEMFHTFQPRLVAEAGSDGSLSDSWFNEGLAVFYQRVLPFRHGMIDAGTFLRDLNYYAGRYYTNILGNLPNAEVAAGFWKDTRIRTLPYDRGFLYFATVDDAMRKNSHGKRSLDDLLLKLLARQRAGHTLVQRDWEEVVRSEIGAAGVAAFEAMLAGTPPLPESNAFGPCFRRVTKRMRRYELGFEPAVLAEPQRIVRGLVAGSAAQQAGLRDGDEITMPVGQDRIQGDQTRLLTLQVRRGREHFAVTYLPRGETVAAWQWERIDTVLDDACAHSAKF